MTPRVPSFVPEGLLLFAVLFGPLAFGAVEPWSRAILQIDLFLLLTASVLRGAPRLDHPVRKFLLPAFLLLIVLGLVQLFNPIPSTGVSSLLPFTASARATGRELLLWASYASLLWCAPQVFESRPAVRRFAWTLFILGAFIAVVGIAQRGQGNTAYYGLRVVHNREPFGPYVNHDHAAAMMVMSALTGGGLFLSRWIDFGNRASVGEKTDVAAAQAATLFLLSIVIFGIISSRSRGAFNSLFISSWITVLLSVSLVGHRGLRWAVFIVSSLLIFGYCAFLWFNPFWIGFLLKTPDLSTEQRLSMYKSGLTALRDFPAWGVGLGAARSAFPAYQEHIVDGLVEHIHNDGLELALEMGAAGVAVALAGFAAYFWNNVISWKRIVSRSARFQAAGAFAAVVAFLFHEGVDFNFHIPANAVIFLTLTCYLGSLTCAQAPRATPRPGLWRAPAAAAALLLACLSARPVFSWWLMDQAAAAPDPDKSALWTQAAEWDGDPEARFLLTRAEVVRADSNVGKRATLLPSAASTAEAVVTAEPLDPRYRSLQGAVLWRLGRPADANRRISEAHLLEN